MPARYFLVALRGIVLKGTELGHLLPQLGALTAVRRRDAGALVGAARAGAPLTCSACASSCGRSSSSSGRIRRLFGLVVVAPILQLTMLGYAATTDVRDVPVVVADGDRTPASRELAGRFDASRNFSVIDTVTTDGRDRAVSGGGPRVARAGDSARATAPTSARTGPSPCR